MLVRPEPKSIGAVGPNAPLVYRSFCNSTGKYFRIHYIRPERSKDSQSEVLDVTRKEHLSQNPRLWVTSYWWQRVGSSLSSRQGQQGPFRLFQ